MAINIAGNLYHRGVIILRVGGLGPIQNTNFSNPPRRTGMASEAKPSEDISVKCPASLHSARPQSLLCDEFRNYCLQFRELVNPGKKDLSIVYGAAGPDLAVPLLTTDASFILALDRKDFRVELLQEVLKKGNAKVYDVQETALDLSGGLEYSPDNPQRFLDFALDHKKKYGYWVASDISTIGIERCLAIELDYLGVNFKDVEISFDEQGGTVISFPWALNGQEPKIREVCFQKANLPADLAGLDFANYDAYLQKSGMTAQNSRNFSQIMSSIDKSAKLGFKVISGRPLNTKEMVHKKTITSLCGNDPSLAFVDLASPDHGSLNSYGQQLILAEKL
jgi:hypothetical protein